MLRHWVLQWLKLVSWYYTVLASDYVTIEEALSGPVVATDWRAQKDVNSALLKYGLLWKIDDRIAPLGAMTSFLAATTGILQNDLKRVIAYSTCSQLGYMIFACGISNYSFHLGSTCPRFEEFDDRPSLQKIPELVDSESAGLEESGATRIFNGREQTAIGCFAYRLYYGRLGDIRGRLSSLSGYDHSIASFIR
ncbi:hypothetical protein L6452_18570 [Arctium lappa]|uniref:Uncharacterized protein n=1 Tax=Arctium lappa TaxID=4217 RepID=A0ACB9C6N8_ARCLA|nr:hypothetical protein L6452_18570 [Arctium lappa]